MHCRDKPFACSVSNCEKRFTLLRSLQHHTRKHQISQNRRNVSMESGSGVRSKPVNGTWVPTTAVLMELPSSPLNHKDEAVNNNANEVTVRKDVQENAVSPPPLDCSLPPTLKPVEQPVGVVMSEICIGQREFTPLPVAVSMQLMSLPPDEPHTCPECGKAFPRFKHLRRHCQVFSAEPPFACAECGMAFSRWEHLRRHRVLHERQRQALFTCPVLGCGELFVALPSLWEHLKLHIDEQREFMELMPSSGEASSADTQQQQQMNGFVIKTEPDSSLGVEDLSLSNKNVQEATTVADTAAFQEIEPSGNGFSCRMHLKRRQVQPAVEKKIPCPECGHTFTTLEHLTRHRLIHTGKKPFVCADCGKAFGRGDHLKQHQLVHSKVKPFVCADCGKAFGLRNCLKLHQLVHSKVKPFVCPQQGCHKRMKYKSSYRSHLRKHLVKNSPCQSD